uniref:Uncharacterized protein n=1 Tax=Anopheles dirus TaxID=7168 RepID=A0A182NVY9_9DIPT
MKLNQPTIKPHWNQQSDRQIERSNTNKRQSTSYHSNQSKKRITSSKSNRIRPKTAAAICA